MWIHGYFIHLLNMLAHEISVLWAPKLCWSGLARLHPAPLILAMGPFSLMQNWSFGNDFLPRTVVFKVSPMNPNWSRSNLQLEIGLTLWSCCARVGIGTLITRRAPIHYGHKARWNPSSAPFIVTASLWPIPSTTDPRPRKRESCPRCRTKSQSRGTLGAS
jgi:hypothetical protein